MITVFVVGATGRQGGATTRALLASGHAVHAYVRDTSSAPAQALQSAGARLFPGDLDNTEALKIAMAGTTAIFFPSTLSLTEADAEVRWARNILDAALAVGTVEHVVHSTVAGTESWQIRPGWDLNPFMINYWRSKAQSETMARNAGFKYCTILKPSEFFENFVKPVATFQFADLVKEGVWRAAWKMDDKVNLIGTEDIGRVVAAVMLDPQRYNGKDIELTAETMSISKLVDLLSKRSGKNLRLHTYERQEAIDIAKVNPVVQGQLMRSGNIVKSRESQTWGFHFQTFSEFLTEHHNSVVDTYKDIHQMAESPTF